MATRHTIELIAPSGYPVDHQAAQRGIERLRQEGHRVEGMDAVRRRFQRFAGTDGERAAELNRLANPAQPLPDVVLAVRGGYGAVRILHGLDYDGLKSRLAGQPTVLVGHSDFTAIQLALLAKAGLVTFGGPMLVANFGALHPSEFTLQHFWKTLAAQQTTVRGTLAQPRATDVSGTLWGGNLAIIASLIGTPYMPSIDGGILFVEDVNEQPFRIERMIYQLHLSGILARQQALVLGRFSGIKDHESDNGYGVAEMIEQVRAVVGIPVITGLPFGHVDDLVTLPIGVPAHLNAGHAGFELTFSGYPNFS
jgi:muramoyltetrapeptide carboxypeptidase